MEYMKRRLREEESKKMNLIEAFKRLPDTDKKVIVTHSGGMDSATAVILSALHYGPENVISLGYNYGQKQAVELEYAKRLCDKLGVERKTVDLHILGDIVRNVSANIGGSTIEMPTIKDVLGNPQPPTYVPYRNLVIFSLTSAFAEANGASHILSGLQVHDEYSYWDTTQKFVDSVNEVTSQNRSWPVTLTAPFSDLSKKQELELLIEAGQLYMLEDSLTCYNPTRISDTTAESCGKCPSCAERIKAFMDIKVKDPIVGGYSIEVPW